MKSNTFVDNAHELGYGVFTKRLSFMEEKKDCGVLYRPFPLDGEGFIYQSNPCPGLFVSLGDWMPYENLERPYNSEQLFVELYFIESGNILHVQNGKKAMSIPQGVNLYINSPGRGRVCYGANIPIKYVSVLLFSDFIRNRIRSHFTEEDFELSEAFNFRASDYNTPEVSLLFLQLKQRLQDRTGTRMYYESKVGELLSIILSNYRHTRNHFKELQKHLGAKDLNVLESVRSAIDAAVTNPPDILQMCRMAAMGKTKLRDSFKAAYGVTIGEYIREAKIKHSLLVLSDSQRTIQSIAAYLGYANPSKFSMAFKRLYGFSPEEYRKKMKIL